MKPKVLIQKGEGEKEKRIFIFPKKLNSQIKQSNKQKKKEQCSQVDSEGSTLVSEGPDRVTDDCERSIM